MVASHRERVLSGTHAGQTDTRDCLANLLPPVGIVAGARMGFQRAEDLAETRRTAKLADSLDHPHAMLALVRVR